MKIELHKITVKDLVVDYSSSLVDGVKGYNGRLDIRPKYQREFVYKDDQRAAVIETVRKDYPLNVMYWAVNNHEELADTYEVLDGQQRTISLAQYVTGDFSINFQFFHNLTAEEQTQIFEYELYVYFCEGNEKEKLDWFKIINIAGEKLTDQELRNAVYTGPWLSEAKIYFSKPNAAAKGLAEKYAKGQLARQEYLETAIDWISGGNIEDYMAQHQHDQSADALWEHFRVVISWIQNTFVIYRKEMKGINWGDLYSRFGKAKLDFNKIEKEIVALMKDEDVTNKKGIYSYILDKREKSLSIRVFTDNMKREAYEHQNGKCIKCQEKFALENMEADHITPWSLGGKTISTNCQMLCKEDNRTKSNK